MKYDLSKDFKVEAAKLHLEVLISRKSHVELKEIRLKRTLDQNGLYWVWLSCLEAELGTNKHELHYLFRCKFLKKEDHVILKTLNEAFYFQMKRIIENFQFIPGINEVIDVISYSTTELDVPQFSIYLKEIQSFSRVHFNVILLNLEDHNFMEFYREYGFR